MAETVEAITGRLHEVYGTTSYPEVSNKQIFREINEVGHPVERALRQTLSPPLLNFFGRLEYALRENEDFVTNLSQAARHHPSHLIPATALPVMPYEKRHLMRPDDFPRVQNRSHYSTYLYAHDEEVPYSGDQLVQALYRRPEYTQDKSFAGWELVGDEFDSGESELPADLRELYQRAHHAQHMDRVCYIGRFTTATLNDKRSKGNVFLTNVEKPLLDVCLRFKYPAYRTIESGSDLFTLTRICRIPVAEVNDPQELTATDKIVRCIATLVRMIGEDPQLSEDLQACLEDPEAQKLVTGWTQRGKDRHVRPDGPLAAVLRIAQEGMGPAIPPMLSELMRPDTSGRRMSLTEITANKKVAKLTGQASISYAGKVFLRAKGLLPPVNDGAHFNAEARTYLRGMTNYMRREFIYVQMKTPQEQTQTGLRCPFMGTPPIFEADVISAAVGIIYQMYTSIDWGETYSLDGATALQQIPPLHRHEYPSSAPSLVPDLEKIAKEYPSGRPYGALGILAARRALLHNRR